jgi:hypothetical protein
MKEQYRILRNFFDFKDVERMAKRMWVLRNSGNMVYDEQCPGSLAIYGDPIHSEMQEKYRYKLGETLGLELYPTYTYSRFYAPKEVLKPHKDRPACEISLTATLDYNTFDNKPWAIWVQEDSVRKSVLLEPGDALVYKGCELTHYRNEFIGVHQSQVFIHYVNAKGPYRNQKYDGRPSLGSSVFTKDMK